MDQCSSKRGGGGARHWHLHTILLWLLQTERWACSRGRCARGGGGTYSTGRGVDTDVGSDCCETYGGDEGGGRGNDPSKIWQVQIELWREKTKYMHGADCRRVLLLLGQKGGRLPTRGNLLMEPSQHAAGQKKKEQFSERINLTETFEISHEDIFAGNLPSVPRICVWCEFCATFLRWLKHNFFQSDLISFQKIR